MAAVLIVFEETWKVTERMHPDGEAERQSEDKKKKGTGCT